MERNGLGDPLIPTEMWAPDRIGRLFDSYADDHATACDSGQLGPVDEWVHQQLASMVESSTELLALDLGCGTGFWAQPLLASGHRVRLVDASEAMLALARERLGSTPVGAVEFVLGDAVAVGRSEADRYDVVLILGELTSYVESTSELLASVANAVQPGGVILGSYMRTEGLLPRLSGGDVLVNDGVELVFCERPALGPEGPLLARAHSDEAILAQLWECGLYVVSTYKDAPSPRGAFVARQIP